MAETSPAGGAGIGLLSCVDQHVRTQMRHLYKAGATGLTLVGLLSGMDAAVCFQVGWPVKTGPTDGAVVRFFPCVHSAVTGQVALVAEGRPAELTLIGLVLVSRSQGI